MENTRSPELTLLDCTLRDGGYYNGWCFSDALVERYLSVMGKAGVDIVEIGFRSRKVDDFYGPYAFSSDQWLSSLPLPEGVTLGVMCNAKELLETEDPEQVVHELFAPRDESPVSLVRIAAHFNEVEACAPAVRALSRLGYQVGLNLMQATGRPREELEAKAAFAATLPLDVLYFADSFGNMEPVDIEGMVDALRSQWSGALGVHTHDNMGNALANTMRACESGCTWLDATVLGMGRGAGNLRTETLLLELDRRGIRAGQEMDALLDLVVGEFGDLQTEHGWGPSIFYHLSALYNVHPTYVQEMLTSERYSHHDVIAALKRLGNLDARSFCPRLLSHASSSHVSENEGALDVTGRLEGRTVLILGSGDQVSKHCSALEQFISRERPYVISTNWNPWISADLVDAWSTCTPERLLLEKHLYEANSGTLIAPRSAIPAEARPSLQHWSHLDFGMKVDPHQFSITSRTATVPSALTLLYAAAYANAAGATTILLAGVDGHAPADPRHQELEGALRLYSEMPAHRPLVAITPTTLHSIRQSTVYAPIQVPPHEDARAPAMGSGSSN
ncbi:aldolase catalytic domain-containing protein [Thioalkalivibrio sp. ALE9]|uniref:aldolase catalytic domain-containing protein n=1 Tax=Thioalkalivibrio sp. ALE9 TaxID=1158169 RepID=UPI0003689A1B|nr:aldolase catalytic domain-containing protein [Thioalkalivibrio sp. ALE9]